MKVVQVIKSSDLQRSLHFYTEVLDLERRWPGHEDRELANGVIGRVREGLFAVADPDGNNLRFCTPGR
jgi:hypothetical protein